MLALHWGAREARLWVDELPAWNYEASEIVEEKQAAQQDGKAWQQKVAIELLVPSGGRIYYGGLAVTFTPAQTRELLVQVPLTADDGVPFDEALAERFEMPFIGLPKAYVSGVLDGLMKAERTAALGSGTLQVSGAVHGRVGSSIWMFKMLGHIVVRLLTLETISEAESLAAIRSEFRWNA